MTPLFVFSLHNKNTQGLIMVISVWLMWSVKHSGEYHNPVQTMLSNCDFDPPGEYRYGPYPPAAAWCETADVLPMVNLGNHMQLNIGSHYAITAQEYGSNVQALLLKNIYIVNPKMLPHDKAYNTVVCTDSIGGVWVTKTRPEWADISFRDGFNHFKPTTIRLLHPEACFAQLAIESWQ